MIPYRGLDQEWKVPLIIEGKIHLLNGEPAEGDYVSTKAEREDDFVHPLVNFVYKFASWPEVVSYIEAISNDFYNLCASIGKIDSFHYFLSGSGISLERFVSTELEYLFTLLKSHFDLLQKVVARIWSHVELVDRSTEKRNLPENFRAMILMDNRIMSPQEIAHKFNIPPSLAVFYNELGHFYQMLKKTRDGIVHHGKEPALIFVLPVGFAISKDDALFRQYDLWQKKDLVNGSLCSIRPLIHHLIEKTVGAFQDYVSIITKVIKFPEDIIPRQTVFTRGLHLKYLFQLQSTIGSNVWWPAIDLKPARVGTAPTSRSRCRLNSQLLRRWLHR